MNEKELEEKLTLLDQLQSSCTHCGLCSEACATFQSSGWEHESPRGRIQLAIQFLHGHLHPESTALSTFDRCLGCQACEPLCPHQVPYHQVRQTVQEIRRNLKTVSSSMMERHQYRRWIQLASRLANRWWRRWGGKWLNFFSLSYKNQGSFSKKTHPLLHNQPVLAVCCVQDLFQHEVIEQTLQFMQGIGYSLQIDSRQPCCGALFERLVHGGEESVCYGKEQQKATILQQKALNAFLRWQPKETYFLAQGCQSFIRKYSPILDLYEWIEKILFQQQLTLYFSSPREVYYQRYCSLRQRQKDPIRRILQAIEGLTLRDISNPHTCCGGYCGEAILHPQQSKMIAEQKVSQLPEQATLIVTSPDCWGLFNQSIGDRQLSTLYPIQLLAQASVRKGVQD